MALSNLLQVTEWSLTSLGGASIAIPVSRANIGYSTVPLEFTSKKSGLVRNFVGVGISGSVSLIPSISRWLRRRLSVSFSPSTFPSKGEVVALQAAMDPFYIDAVRGYYAIMLSYGIDVGYTKAMGVLLFTIFPPAGVLAVAAELSAIAVCFFETSGLAMGGSGPYGEQDLLRIN